MNFTKKIIKFMNFLFGQRKVFVKSKKFVNFLIHVFPLRKQLIVLFYKENKSLETIMFLRAC